VASFSCEAPGDVKSVFEFQRTKLLSLGFKELPNSSITDEAASAMFGKKGFVVSVSVFPQEPSKVLVSIQNHGNIRPGKLPVPPNVKPVYVGDSTAMYVTDAAVAETKDACRKLLLADGWVPYGGAGDSSYYKQNAMRVEATVSSAPAQGGKTMISYLGFLMSADLPAPSDAEELRYTEQTRELSFETTEDQKAIVDFYKKALAQAKWEPTMDHTGGDRRQTGNDFPESDEGHANACDAAAARRETVGVASASERCGDRGAGPAVQRTRAGDQGESQEAAGRRGGAVES